MNAANPALHYPQLPEAAIFGSNGRRKESAWAGLMFVAFFLVSSTFWILATSVWSFYVSGDLYNSVMVAAFFAFLNDIVNADGAKRLYGPIILGGVDSNGTLRWAGV